MIIILNGSPSAGKTSIIKEMQKLYPKPLLDLGIDNIWKIIPEHYKEFGEKSAEGYSFIQTTDDTDHPIVEVKRGQLAQQIDHTMAQVIKCIADCDHDVIADMVLREKTTLNHYIKALANHTVYFIRVTCDLDELERREQSRGNRIIGLAREHRGFVDHYKAFYDLIIDSTYCSPAECAQKILDFIQKTPHPQSFKK